MYRERGHSLPAMAVGFLRYGHGEPTREGEATVAAISEALSSRFSKRALENSKTGESPCPPDNK
jgi:hypothetical protein